MEIKDIEKLAKLARIELTAEEKQAYLKDMGAILGYIDQLKAVVAKTGEAPLRQGFAGLKNVMRIDEEKKENKTDAEAIIKEFPEKQGNYLKVKKIL